MRLIKRYGLLLFFVGIPLVPLLAFWFVPMFVSLWLSTTDWDYISPKFNHVMLENYQTIFTDANFYSALKNTAFFGVMTVVPTIILGLLFAIVLKNVMKGSTLFKSLLFSPWITPMVAMSIVWTWIFQADVGLLNQILGWLHLPQPAWLTDSDTAMWAIIIVTIWKNAGWAMIFYADALSKIPGELYEVGEIEGTSWWQNSRFITIPLVSPTTLFLIIISLIDAIQAYDQIQVMTQGGPAGSTRTLLYLYYQMAFEQFNMGQATALSTIIVLLTGLLAFLLFYASKKWVHY